MFSKICTVATLALVVGFGTATKAEAAPLFLTPDYNFATTGTGMVSVGQNYSMTVNTAVGDSIVVDSGKGFSFSSNTTINALVIGKTGALAINVGGELGASMSASLLTSHVTNTVLGHDVFAVFKVTSSTLTGFKVGALVGLDILAYNCTTLRGIESCKIKGDVAPIVPEPATLSLLVIGLGGLVTGARRKIS